MKTGERRPELDGVRGVAILLVLVGHADYRLAPLAAAGVALFFVLSGYLITGLLLAERERCGRLDLRRFYVRRMTRLAPPLFVMLATMGVLLRSGWEQLLPPALWLTNYAGHLGADVEPFGHTWSLAVEEQFYLVWPVALLLLLRRRDPVRTLRCVMLALVAWWGLLIATGHLDYAYSALETAGVPILGGCLVALRNRQSRHSAAETVVALVLFAGALVVANVRGAWLAVPMLSVPLTVAVVASARGSRWLAWRPLGFCGVASYSMYLWHLPMAWLVGGGRVTPLGVLIGAGAGLVAWVIVERPLMALRRRGRVVTPSREAAGSQTRPTIHEPAPAGSQTRPTIHGRSQVAALNRPTTGLPNR